MSWHGSFNHTLRKVSATEVASASNDKVVSGACLELSKCRHFWHGVASHKKHEDSLGSFHWQFVSVRRACLGPQAPNLNIHMSHWNIFGCRDADFRNWVRLAMMIDEGLPSSLQSAMKFYDLGLVGNEGLRHDGWYGFQSKWHVTNFLFRVFDLTYTCSSLVSSSTTL